MRDKSSQDQFSSKNNTLTQISSFELHFPKEAIIIFALAAFMLVAGIVIFIVVCTCRRKHKVKPISIHDDIIDDHDIPHKRGVMDAHNTHQAQQLREYQRQYIRGNESIELSHTRYYNDAYFVEGDDGSERLIKR